MNFNKLYEFTAECFGRHRFFSILIYLFLSLSYGTQVYSFAAIPAICRLCFFYFFVAIFVTTIWRHNHFKSAFCSLVHAISTELRAWRHFSLWVERVCCSFAWLNFWSHLTYLTLKNDFVTLKLTYLLWFKEIRSNGCVCHSKWRFFESSY